MLGLYFCIFYHLRRIQFQVFWGNSLESLKRFLDSKGASLIYFYRFQQHLSLSTICKSLTGLLSLVKLKQDFITASKSLSDNFDCMGSVFFSCYDSYLQGNDLHNCISPWSSENTVNGILYSGIYSQQVEEALERACQYLETKLQFINDIRSALVYPVISLLFIQIAIILNCYFLNISFLYTLPGFIILFGCSLIYYFVSHYSLFKFYGLFYSLYLMQRSGASLQDSLRIGSEIFIDDPNYKKFTALIFQGQPFQSSVLCLLGPEAYIYAYGDTISACNNLALSYKERAQRRIQSLKVMCSIFPLCFAGLCCCFLTYIFINSYVFQITEVFACA